MSDQGKELARRWCEAILNQQNLAVCDEIIADRYVENAMATFGQTAPGEVPGPEQMRLGRLGGIVPPTGKRFFRGADALVPGR
jgi:hypothetical protein